MAAILNTKNCISRCLFSYAVRIVLLSTISTQEIFCSVSQENCFPKALFKCSHDSEIQDVKRFSLPVARFIEKFKPCFDPPNAGPIHTYGSQTWSLLSQIVKFMGQTWGPPGSCWPQMGPMNLAIRSALATDNVRPSAGTALTKRYTTKIYKMYFFIIWATTGPGCAPYACVITCSKSWMSF